MGILDIMNKQSDQANSSSKIYGVHIALVTNNNDPDNMGRVKLKYPWYSDADESYWARIAVTMAGNEMGTFFLPEVDNEVLVAFEDGAIDKPYVIGALWNGQDKPPLTNPEGEKNNKRQIKSRSGHTLTFVDDKEDKKEKIEIKTALGHIIDMSDKDSKGGVKIATNGGHTLNIDDENKKIDVIDCNDNKIEMTDKGTKVTDKNSNVIEMNDQGIKVTDSNGNEIKKGSSGIDIKDSNGNKIAMSGSGVDINSKFSVSS